MSKNITNNDIFYSLIPSFHYSSIKPLISNDERGPWEVLWNKFIDIFGENKYALFVWGK